MRRVSRPGRLILSTVTIGVLVGIGATGFHFVADRFGEILFAWVESQTAASRLPFVLIVPTVGLGLVGLILQYYPPGREGGVREVFESLEQHAGVIPFNRIWNVGLSALVLAFGGSVGPEGPMVQMGALVGSLVGRRCRLTRNSLQTLVRAGAAAGISAAFRSPAGGVLMALEVFGARFNRELTAISAAAGIAFLTRTAVLGDAYPFSLAVAPQAVPISALLLIATLMGLFAAPTGYLFISWLAKFKTFFPAGWPLSARVALGGLLVGAIGVYYPQVMSAGYPVIVKSLHGGLDLKLLVMLLFLKMLATWITFGSGAVGGLFAPTLVIGAMYGGAFGFGFHALLPALVPQPELYVLLGMIVMFGSIVKGYWSGLLLIADMSGAYQALLLPGIIAGGISFLLSWELHDLSVFGLPLEHARADAVVARRDNRVLSKR